MKKQRTKILLPLIIGFVIIGSGYALFILALIFSGVHEVPSANADTMIILGAQVWGDTDPYPSPVLQERLDAALICLTDNEDTTVIVCGSQGVDESDSEANVMAQYLIDHGIQSQRIIKEDTSTTTAESLTNAQQLNDVDNAVIVTNDYHVYRALMLARRLGIEDPSGLPAASATSVTFKSYLREILALGYHYIFSR